MVVKKGTILIAEPFMTDAHFNRTVVLICDRHKEGVLGFILNKPSNIKFQELAEGLPDFDALVYYGGPVGHDTLHYVHTLGDLIPESIKICEGVYWGGDFEQLRFLITSKLITENEIRFFIGYSGWDVEQMKGEIKSGSWVRSTMHPNYLTKTLPENLWTTSLAHKGDNFEVISTIPEDMSWN